MYGERSLSSNSNKSSASRSPFSILAARPSHASGKKSAAVLRPSVLTTSGADLLIYGMGDKPIREVAKALRNGFNMKLLRGLRQVGFLADRAYVERLFNGSTKVLSSFEECQADKRKFAENFTEIETLSNMMECNTTLVERSGDAYVVITPPHETLTTEELDHSFDLPYERAPHPRYRGKGDIPAWEMIKHSINIHRGCFGGCSFCTISAHQGKFINSRSERSILDEVRKVVAMPDFKGYISDIGAPSANMYGMRGRDESLCKSCRSIPKRAIIIILHLLPYSESLQR